MNIVADAGVDSPIIKRLREAGHTVWAVAEMAPSLSDNEVFELANREQAVLLTTDRDFGRITWSVILIRLLGIPPTRKAEMVCEAIRRHENDLPHVFAMISPGAIRLRQPLSSLP